jgi:hypothetical protein
MVCSSEIAKFSAVKSSNRVVGFESALANPTQLLSRVKSPLTVEVLIVTNSEISCECSEFEFNEISDAISPLTLFPSTSTSKPGSIRTLMSPLTLFKVYWHDEKVCVEISPETVFKMHVPRGL